MKEYDYQDFVDYLAGDSANTLYEEHLKSCEVCQQLEDVGRVLENSDDSPNLPDGYWI